MGLAGSLARLAARVGLSAAVARRRDGIPDGTPLFIIVIEPSLFAIACVGRDARGHSRRGRCRRGARRGSTRRWRSVADGDAVRDTLRLAGVRKSYGVGTPVEVEVLHGIDLVLQRGEFAALIGPSGSGKTTLLNLIGLLDRPSAGRIVRRGAGRGRARRNGEATRLRGRAIGFIFQYHYLLPAFTALENVMMPILAARGRADDEMRDDRRGAARPRRPRRRGATTRRPISPAASSSASPSPARSR